MKKFSRAQESLGTRIDIQVWSSHQEKAFSTIELAFLESQRIDKKFSRFRSDNVLAEIRKNVDKKIPLDEESFYLFDTAKNLEHLSQGLFHLGVGSLMEHQGYNAEYSLRPLDSPKPIISPWTLSSEPDSLWIQSAGPLDLGGLGKGYALDKMMDFFYDFEHVLINAGGDILCKGMDLDKGAWIVGLEDPLDPEIVLGVLELHNEAFAASSGEKRRWHPDVHHIMNPTTQSSSQGRLASFVRAPQAIFADALATLFYIQDSEKNFAFAPLLQAEFATIEKDLQILASPNFQVRWF